MIFFLSQTSHTVHHAAGAGAHEASHAHPEMVNWIQLLAKSIPASPVSEFLLTWEKAIFSFMVVALISFFVIRVSRKASLIPSKAQLLLEFVVMTLDGLVCGVLGPRGRVYTPFIGTLFIYIFISNMVGLISLQNSTMAFITTTVPLSLCVFLYVQWIGIAKNGLGGYLYHMAGSPKDVFGYILVPLNLPLHILSEFIKPLSLSFRLYGNIMGGHILLAVFVTMGVKMLAGLHVPFGVPLHFPFIFLEILIGTIQAFVFTLLSTVYIAMMLPHENEHDEALPQHA